ncbi:MAG: ABC transporter substrate-binding protein [Lachnospiraceae bacterium]|nr:ABC transporter substrate-binding protein [Lachnospiraceae bacterium]
MKNNRSETAARIFRKGPGRRLAAGMTAACVLTGAALAGCPVKAEESESAMGRYLEYEVTLPEAYMNLYNLTVMEDGTLRLLAEAFDESWEECVCGFWDSTDGGETWELAAELPELENLSIVTTALCEDGTGALIYVESFWKEEDASVDEAADSEISVEFSWGEEDVAVDETAGSEITAEYSREEEEEVAVGTEEGVSGETVIEIDDMDESALTENGGMDKTTIEINGADEETLTEGDGAGEDSIVENDSAGEDSLTEGDSVEEETGSESASFFWGTDEMGEMTVEYRLFTFDETGVTGEVLLSGEYYGSLFYSRDGSLFYREYSESVYQLDPETGVARMEYPVANQAEMILAATSCGSELVVVTDGSVLRYDIASGEMLEEDTALAEAIFADSSAASTIVMTEDADGRLFYATSGGIYTHQMDGSVVEQVADGGLNSLSEPGCTLDVLAVSGDVFYTIYFSSGVDGDSSESPYGIRKYEYSADASSVPENELTIWSLNEDAGIRQSIYLYQKDHPDTYITYEVGITEESGVTASDAIRTLNTEILAGSGPDILILDGLSVDTYTSQGLLLDLTDLMAEIQESDGFLENIAYTYQDEDGVWAAPLQFDIPVLAGLTESVADTEGLASLVEEAANGVYDVCGEATVLYEVCAGSWEKEDGTIDQEQLAEYVHIVKQLVDSYLQAADDDAENRVSFVAYYSISGADSLENASLSFVYGNTIAAANLSNMMDFRTYTSVVNTLGDGAICTLTGQQENVFVPMCTIGILTMSPNQDTAESFVSYLLSEDGQLSRPEYGWPVNAAAFYSLLYENSDEETSWTMLMTDGDENSIEIEGVWPSGEDLEWLFETAYGLTVRSEDGAVQKEVVMEQLERCLNGEISEEEAVSEIMQKINLYLAE